MHTQTQRTMANGITVLSGCSPNFSVEQDETVTIIPASNQPDFDTYPKKYFIVRNSRGECSPAILCDELDLNPIS